MSGTWLPAQLIDVGQQPGLVLGDDHVILRHVDHAMIGGDDECAVWREHLANGLDELIGPRETTSPLRRTAS